MKGSSLYTDVSQGETRDSTYIISVEPALGLVAAAGPTASLTVQPFTSYFF